jgi:hypothetical protein
VVPHQLGVKEATAVVVVGLFGPCPFCIFHISQIVCIVPTSAMNSQLAANAFSLERPKQEQIILKHC